MSEHPHDALLQRYERRMTRALADALTAWQKAIVRGVPAADAQQIVQRVETTAQPLRDVIVDWLRQAAEAGVQQAVAEVERDIFGVKNTDALVAGFAWDQANEAAAQWALAYGSRLVKEIQRTTQRRLNSLVGDWIENGEPFKVLIDRIAVAGDFLRPRAEMIAVTEVTRAFAEGNTRAWRASGVIERRRWQTSNDEIVCPICGPLHNAVVRLDQQFPGGYDSPPAHPRCRCWLTPVTSEAQARPVGLENQPSVGIAGDPVPPSIEQILSGEPRRVPVVGFETDAAATEWGNRHFLGWADSLDAAEKDALVGYGVSDYRWINKELRTGSGIDAESLEAHRLLDSAISKGRAPETVKVFRGLQNRAMLDNFDNLAGTVIEDKAYISTSLSKQTASNFLADADIEPILADIIVPKGTPAAFVDAVFEEWERELLLGRGTRFRVNRTFHETVDVYGEMTNVRRIEIEVLP